MGKGSCILQPRETEERDAGGPWPLLVFEDRSLAISDDHCGTSLYIHTFTQYLLGTCSMLTLCWVVGIPQ